MSSIEAVSDESFEAAVLKEKKLTVVDFWAPWCGPCKAIAPILDEIAAEFDQVKCVKINVDEHKQVAGQYGVRGIPTLLFFSDGQLVETKVGLMNKEELIQLINTLLK